MHQNICRGPKKKVYDLIFHSRIIGDKGIREIIGALEILRRKNIHLKTLILGNPDEKNRSSITIDQLNFWVKEKFIIWKPKVSNVIPFLQKSKISILPSYREGLPKGLLEAASCKLPIISTNVPGCREICINNFNGFLVEPRDAISLAKSIEKLALIKDYKKNLELIAENWLKKSSVLILYQKIF